MNGGKRQAGKREGSITDFPLISIITPVLNAGKELETNIATVERQTYPNKEHIIIDGCSTDDTLTILQKNNDRIDFWISESDSGIYDAMNKGIDAAHGEWIYFLGVDDRFQTNDTLTSVMKSKDITDDVDLICGKVIYPDGKIFNGSFSRALYFKNTIHHQGAFYRRRVFSPFRYGRTNTRRCKTTFAVSGDYQLNLGLFVKQAKHIHVDKIIAKCGRGVSMEGKWIGYHEEIKIRHLYMNVLAAMIFDITTLLRYVWKKIKSI